MKYIKKQLLIFILFNLVFLFNSKIQHNLKSKKIVWDTNEKIKTEAIDTAKRVTTENNVMTNKPDEKKIKSKVEETKQEMKIDVKEKKTEIKVETKVQKKEKNVEKKDAKLQIGGTTIDVLKNTDTSSTQTKSNITVDNKTNSKDTVTNVNLDNTSNDQGTIEQNKDKKYESVTIVKNYKLNSENRVNSNMNNQNQGQVQKQADTNNNSTKPIAFESVHYVKELSPAGKAALEAQESGE
jgi:hypothetical protein